MLSTEKTLYDSIPSLDGYKFAISNTHSRIYLENGSYEIEIYSSKTFTNENCTLRITLDITRENIERVYTIYEAYEYLTEKGNIKKFTIQKGKLSLPVIIENNTGFLLFLIEEKNEKKGLLLKSEYEFNKKIAEEKLTQLILNDLLNLSQRIDFKRLASIIN